MGTSERKEREKQELRDIILDTSKSILLSQGKEGLSIRNIATRIEYSPATIYTYFKDKDAILHELMEIGFEKLGSYMMSAYLEEDPATRLHKIGKAYIRFGLENKDWYDLMFNSPSPMKHIADCKTDWDKGAVMFSFLTLTCADFITKHRRQLSPEIMAFQLWSNVHGMINLSQTGRIDIVRLNANESLLYETLDSILQSIVQH